jgi:hypothetical protein
VAPAATWRDFLRTGCGPAASTLVKFGFSPDDVATYAVPFGLVWPAWLVLVWFSPLRRLPLGLHALLGVLWCFGGCCGLDADALKQFLR